MIARPPARDIVRLDGDGLSSHRDPAPAHRWGMISSEIRQPPSAIMPQRRRPGFRRAGNPKK
jgi:hypothetical protein